jgi:hypothetical protein
MSLDEIAECLALGKTTVWYWIKDLPDPEIKHRETDGRRRSRALAAAANKKRFAAARQAAYDRGAGEFDALERVAGFRDFVCMYIGEGYKRNRNRVSIANSDAAVIALAYTWIRRLSDHPIEFSLQYHADQDLAEVTRFWGTLLDIDPGRIRLQRKSNSGQLRGRTWRSQYGVLSITVNDTYLRSRLQAWIDQVRGGWLDSTRDGV